MKSWGFWRRYCGKINNRQDRGSILWCFPFIYCLWIPAGLVADDELVPRQEQPMTFIQPGIELLDAMLEFEDIAAASGVLGKVALADSPEGIAGAHGINLLHELAFVCEIESAAQPRGTKEQEANQASFHLLVVLPVKGQFFLHSRMKVHVLPLLCVA